MIDNFSRDIFSKLDGGKHNVRIIIDKMLEDII